MQAKTKESKGTDLFPNRPRPSAVPVEKRVMAAILHKPAEALSTVFDICGKDSDIFYSGSLRKIFEACLEMEAGGQTIDVVMLAQTMREKRTLDAVGGENFLMELYESFSTIANMERWCNTLKKYRTLRKTIEVCYQSLVKCYDEEEKDAGELVNEIEGDFYKIRGEDINRSIYKIGDLVEPECNYLLQLMVGKIESGIPTGFAQVDRCTGGLKPGEMFVLAARPGIGKTSLALNIIRNVTVMRPDSKCVAFFSLEMTEKQITRRLLCTHAEIPESKFRHKNITHSEVNRLSTAAAELAKARLFIDPTPAITMSELRVKARRLVKEEHVELLVIDYLTLIRNDRRLDNRQQEVSEISGGIKRLAKDLNIPILILAQLNREVDKTSGKSAKPKLANLRESGAIEQDADIVSFLHRDREESKNLEQDSATTEAIWIIEKNRNGQTADCKLLFTPALMKFDSAAPVPEKYDPPSVKK